MQIRGLEAFLSFVAVTILLQSAAFADYVVVKAEGGVDLKPGSVVADSQKVVLADKQSVTLVSSKGVKLTLKGPFNGMVPIVGGDASAAQADKTVMSSLAGLFADEAKNTQMLGATRALGPGALKVGAWDIPVGNSGNFCVQRDQPPLLWRAKARYKQVLVIKPESGKDVELAWQRKRDRLSWPSTVEIKDGGRYSLRFANKAEAIDVTLHVTGDSFPSDLHLASWMISKQCTQQALVVIESMEEQTAAGN